MNVPPALNPCQNERTTDQPLALTGGLVLLDDAFVTGRAVIVKGQKIADIVPDTRIPSDCRRMSFPDHFLVPGLIDAQVNGGGNILFNKNPTAEGALGLLKAHQSWGTARLLPTCMTDGPDVTAAAVRAVAAARAHNPGILGIHIEGPHLSPARPGIHDPTWIRPVNDADMALYRPDDSKGIVLLTIAPDMVPPATIAPLAAQGTILSIGHTTVTPDEIRAALAAGVRGFTHLYTAMGPIATRVPGPAAAALDDQDHWCGIIGDAGHLAPELIRIAFRARPKDKNFIVSDAVAPAGARNPLAYEMNGKRIVTRDGVCVDADLGTLAGSAMTLGACVRHCITRIGLDPVTVFHAASRNVAAFLKRDHMLGSIAPGYAADITVFTPDYTPHHLFVDGQSLSCSLGV